MNPGRLLGWGLAHDDGLCERSSAGPFQDPAGPAQAETDVNRCRRPLAPCPRNNGCP